MAYFDSRKPSFTLKVRDPPTGPLLGSCILEEGIEYMLGYHWDAIEQQKWREFKDKNDLPDLISGLVGAIDESLPCIVDEKDYLKQNWRNEYHFLLIYGLGIHKEEDRAEGRSILRAFKSKDTFNGTSGDDEFSLEGHQYEYLFPPHVACTSR